jgi:hypothetical protein
MTLVWEYNTGFSAADTTTSKGMAISTVGNSKKHSRERCQALILSLVGRSWEKPVIVTNLIFFTLNEEA